MIQVLQDTRSGEMTLAEVPPPAIDAKSIRVRTAASLISAGTERAMIDLAKKSLAGKARARPDLARQVIDKARKEGVVRTVKTVLSRLERPMPLGYSAAGVVEQVGAQVTEFKVGDRVAIAGAGYANHAEVNCVPKNLATHIPSDVPFSSACYTTVASIAMQGVRIARPELGEFVAVIGQGLIGLITTQILVANGCRVIGIDPDQSKSELAMRFGAEACATSPEEATRVVHRVTGGRLADCSVITAATKSSGPIELAGELTRRKGSVIVVGAVGMDIPRDIYYKKELDLRISMSYGPGRYDPQYEEGGVDYPYDYVRWTEQRNMESVLSLLNSGRLEVEPLTTHRFTFENALDAYSLISDGKEPHIGVILEYDLDKPQEEVVTVAQPAAGHERRERLSVGFVGAGNYAAAFLLPPLQKNEAAVLSTLVTATGLNAEQKARKFGFATCTTQFDELLRDDALDSVFIATRHSTHADFSIRALEAGKHVFVEKPLVVTPEQLVAVEAAWKSANESKPTGLMVGLNRRFAPMVQTLRSQLSVGDPMQLIYRVNSGHIPTSTWLHEEEEGGGMLVGEMCHFIDLMVYLTGASPLRVHASSMQMRSHDMADTDNVAITVSFDDGSLGTLNYNTAGDKAAPKERLEVFSGGRVGLLDDFRELTIYAGGKKTRNRSANQNKGQRQMLDATVDSFRQSGSSPIPIGDLVATMRAVFAARDSIRSGQAIDIS